MNSIDFRLVGQSALQAAERARSSGSTSYAQRTYISTLFRAIAQLILSSQQEPLSVLAKVHPDFVPANDDGEISQRIISLQMPDQLDVRLAGHSFPYCAPFSIPHNLLFDIKATFDERDGAQLQIRDRSMSDKLRAVGSGTLLIPPDEISLSEHQTKLLFERIDFAVQPHINLRPLLVAARPA